MELQSHFPINLGYLSRMALPCCQRSRGYTLTGKPINLNLPFNADHGGSDMLLREQQIGARLIRSDKLELSIGLVDHPMNIVASI